MISSLSSTEHGELLQNWTLIATEMGSNGPEVACDVGFFADY